MFAPISKPLPNTNSRSEPINVSMEPIILAHVAVY